MKIKLNSKSRAGGALEALNKVGAKKRHATAPA